MRKIILGAALAAMALSTPLAAQAQVVQGTVNGAAAGAAEGSEAAGPIGGLVGGAVGAGVGAAAGAVGTAGAILGVDERPRFREYAATRPSYAWEGGEVRVGTVLPRRGVVFYPVPREYHVASRYRYSRINDQVVIVDPRSRRIVEVIE
jgi:hypothetical protein